MASGGLSSAIAHLAESEYARLDADERPDVRALLLRLTGPGEGDAVTRRRVARSELAALPRDPARLVERLAAARLLTVSDEHVEVAHEALFREWPRLRGWLDDDRSGREVERRLAVATTEWNQENRDPALLWRGTRLDAGLEVAARQPQEVTADERAFLAAGRDAVEGARRATERQNRRLRVLLVTALALILVATVAGGFALRSRSREAAAATSAERAAVEADARRLAASALTVEQADLALLTAVEATRLEQSPETYGAVLTLLARQPDVVARIRTPNRFLAVAADPAGETVFIAENLPILRAVDAATGAPRWRRDLPEQVGNIAVSADGHTLAVTLAAATPGGDGLVLLDAATGRTRREVTLRAINRFTGGRSPVIFWNLGYTRAGRLVVATEDAAVVLSPGGRLLKSVPWPRRVFEDISGQVWPDGRVSARAWTVSTPSSSTPREDGRNRRRSRAASGPSTPPGAGWPSPADAERRRAAAARCAHAPPGLPGVAGGRQGRDGGLLPRRPPFALRDGRARGDPRRPVRRAAARARRPQRRRQLRRLRGRRTATLPGRPGSTAPPSRSTPPGAEGSWPPRRPATPRGRERGPRGRTPTCGPT